MPAAVEPAAVASYLGGNLSSIQLEELREVCRAVNIFVARHIGEELDADHKLGAKMLAARWFRRRNSPGGVENMGDMGAVYIQRTDPDVAILLRIGGYRRPRIR